MCPAHVKLPPLCRRSETALSRFTGTKRAQAATQDPRLATEQGQVNTMSTVI